MPCPSTVALQLCEACFPEVSSALWRVGGRVDSETVSGNSADPERFTEKQIKQPFSVFMLSGCSAAGQ